MTNAQHLWLLLALVPVAACVVSVLFLRDAGRQGGRDE